MKKIKIAGLAAGLLFLAGMTGYSGKKPPIEWTMITPKSTSLEIWAWDETFNIKAADLAVKKYQEQNPYIEINVVTKEKNEILEKLTKDFSAGSYEELPDIVLVEDYDIQKLLSSYENEFLAMDEVLDYSQYQDYKSELVSKEGIHYGVPFDSGAAVMFYRKDYIEAAGYTEADMENITWEKYIEIGKKVKETAGVPMLTVQPDDLGIIRIMMQSGGSWYVDESGENVDMFHNVPLRGAVGIYEELLSENLTMTVKSWDDFTAAFKRGEVATVVSGCWIAPTIRQTQEQSGQWRVAQIPRMEDVPGAVNASNIGGSGWYVLNHKDNKEEAARFLKETFGEDKELINDLVKEINLISTRKDAAELPAYQTGDEFFGETNIFQVFLEATENVPVVNYGGNTYEIEGVLEEEMQTYIKEKDMDSSLQRAEMRAQIILE